MDNFRKRVLGYQINKFNLGSLSLKLDNYGASLVAQMVKNLSAMQETRVRSLGQEDLLEKGMATYSSCLEESDRLQPMASQRVGHD